jgi:hypothetical protein
MRRFPTTPLAALLLAPTLLACTTRDDDYLLLRRTAAQTAPGQPVRLELAARNDSEAYYMRHLLSSGFGAELLRTYAMTKRFASRTWGYSDTTTLIALGAPDLAPPGAPRQVKAGFWTTTLAADEPLVWIDGNAPLHRHSAMGELVSALGGAIVDVVAPETGLPYSRSRPLREGYAAFLQVVAAEWRAPSDIDDRDELRWLPAFAEVRANRAVRRDPRGIEDPMVVATVLYRLASSELRQKMADPAVYEPFLEVKPPHDVHPALLLGAFRNFQAKLLAAWSRAAQANRPPHNIVDLVEAYADAYPAERAEATRIFLVTTYGATALPEVVDCEQSPEQVQTQLAALTADVLFGRRGLRDGLPRNR